MRKKGKVETHSSYHIQLHFFILKSSTSCPSQEQFRGVGNGDCGKSMAAPLCCFFSSHFFLHLHSFLPWTAVLQDKPVPAWVFHGLQFLQEIFPCSSIESCMGFNVDINPTFLFLKLQ